jgi:ABC-type lipoprotein export system ATPase subunit
VTVADPRNSPSLYIACDDVFKIYKIADLEVVALRGLDLHVERGELMAIVGASGSGKTTLLNILAGLDQPSAGRVSVGGRDLLTMTEADMVEYRRKEVGFIWQQTGRNLIPYLDAVQNVELPMLLAGRPRREATERARELLDAVGLSHRLSHRPQELSGGEQQRVSIAVALANDPPLLLADEPTGELDTVGASAVFDLLARLNRQLGVTVVIVTHDPAIAARVNRVVAIRDGRTSSEVHRRVRPGGNVADVVHEEYILVDGTGRLQIPRPYLEEAQIGERVRVEIRNGEVVITPGRGRREGA